MLLARRLVENNVRFVEVQLGGWDTHTNNFTSVSDRAATVDRALSALIGDLESRGLLDETLIVLATEFGRTPGSTRMMVGITILVLLVASLQVVALRVVKPMVRPMNLVHV